MAATNVKPLFTIIAVVREQSDPARYADSTPVSFSYRLKTADLPVADPVTSLESPATLMNGERISLNTQSGDVDIYYTLDSTTPRPEDYKAWLENKGTVGADGSSLIPMPAGRLSRCPPICMMIPRGFPCSWPTASSLLKHLCCVRRRQLCQQQRGSVHLSAGTGGCTTGDTRYQQR